MGLDRYNRKRDFTKTPEPTGGIPSVDEQTFVIQKHDARSLHYDFRLEVGGVLKSWAVPKGPSTNPADKRLAMLTEDHPLDYGGFEGMIPAGQYGAGAVIVWDRGTYRNITEKSGVEVPMAEALEAGHAAVWLEGEKIRGGFALTRVARGKKERWLLVKMRDEEADARRNPVSTQPQSVLSGRNIEDLSADQ